MRRLSGVAGWAVGGWAAAAALFHIWTAYAGAWEPREMRAIHLLFLIPLAFVLYADEGVLGSLTGISSNLLMIFILFAAFMLHSGVGQFFMDISILLAGRFRGGPAKVAVLSSGLYGTISGSSVADCYATGTFTIPLMKKIGYKPEIAAGIEATASCGGPLMPPIMGAGAFIMAELTGVPYQKIIVAAALPAILYYLSIMATVHWEALAHGIGTMKAEMPPLSSLLRRALLF